MDTMRLGYKCLMKSADKAGGDEGEPDKIDLWLNRHFGEKATAVLTGFASVIAVVAAVLMFLILPTFAVKGLDMLLPLGGFASLIEGLIKIAILVGLYGGGKPYEGHPPDVSVSRRPSIKLFFVTRRARS